MPEQAFEPNLTCLFKTVAQHLDIPIFLSLMSRYQESRYYDWSLTTKQLYVMLYGYA